MLVLLCARKLKSMFNQPYEGISSISPTFNKLIKKETQAVADAGERAIEEEVVLAKLCQQHGVSLTAASNNRLEREAPSVALVIGDQVHRWKSFQRGVQAAELSLRNAEAAALTDAKVLAEVAAQFIELQTTLIQANAATTKALTQVTSLEGGLQASKKVTDLLRTARGGKTSLVKGNHGTEADPLVVAERIGAFAQAMIATEKVNV